MPSPFKNIGGIEVEEWGGQYDCLEVINGRRCNSYAHTAKYIKSERVLTWICANGHTSILEDIDDE